MPIQEKDLGKYVRPGIYIEEQDASVISTPPTQNVLINLIPGFSKKGPFNYPVYIDTNKTFISTFGDVDTQLERKGSYFHRTCLKMLETGPIWALNLLSTVSGRDQLNYVSMSTTAKYSSSDVSNPYVADYELFFNRQDFWTKDTEIFLDMIKDSTHNDGHKLLHLTNMGDKTVTVFMFKSTASNFDVTAEVWYNGASKVPSYMHPKSLISDYLVGVLIIEGNWSDYTKLSTDNTWSKYFDADGLIISNMTSFVNEKQVTVLGNYDTSLIPNFTDASGRNMFIQDVINAETNKTSLYSAFNKDLLLDSDYLSDLVDMIGFTIVGNTAVENINFLSYSQTIKEPKSYPVVSLDSANNVFAPNVSTFGAYGTTNLNWSTNGISVATNQGTANLNCTITTSSASYIINGVTYSGLTGASQVITLEDLTDIGYKRADILYLDSNGVQFQTGIEVLSGDTTVYKEINFNNNNTIILGTVLVTKTGASTYTKTYTGVSVNASGFIAVSATYSTGTTVTNENYLSVEFTNTSGSTLYNNQYDRLRSVKYYTELTSNISSYKGVIVKSTGTVKTEITSFTATNYNNSGVNANVKIYLTTPSDYTSCAIYYVDKEFNYSTSTTGMTTTYTSSTNVVAKYSDFYQDYINGVINNGDYIENGLDKVFIDVYVDSSNLLYVSFDNALPTSTMIVKSDIGNYRQTLEIENISELDFVTIDGNTVYNNVLSIKVKKDRYAEVKKGSYLEAYYDVDYYLSTGLALGDTTPRKLTRIINVKNDTVDTSLKILYTDSPIKITDNSLNSNEKYTTVYPAIYQYATRLKGSALAPFKIHIDSIPNGTETRLNTILDVMGKGTQMSKGLVNKNKITWRYLVDSFGLGLSELSKQQYVDLCGAKLNCFGFINLPSVKSFKKSSNPSFIDEYGAFSTAYLKDGANLDKNPNFLYSFGEGVGASTVGYFFPYVKHTINGVASEVPPAAFVASTYMRKQLSNTTGTHPWTIAAGIGDGRVTGIGGTEMDFTDEDLTNLAAMGVNPVTFIRNNGYIIGDESSAQVYPVSSLSYIHSRELLIELENQLYDMLLRYQWKFNTPGIRSEIKYKADSICRSLLDAGGIYAFKNVIDETNNTNYIIDLQGGTLDTHVEIVKGMGWIVNNITVEKTGTLNSTGFGA